MRIVPLADDRQLREATRRCLEQPLDIVIGTTGVGFRGWIEAAGAWGDGEALIKAIGRATVLARGPKVRGAIRAAGLREQWSPESESSSEVLEYLMARDLDGRRIAIQLHGDPLTDMVQALRLAGAEVIEVPVYRWVPPEDPAPLERLIEAVSRAAVDAVAFTSAPAAASFLRTAHQLGHGGSVHAALCGPVVPACVGPVTAGPLLAEGIPVIQPARARLGALVKEIVEQVPARRARWRSRDEVRLPARLRIRAGVHDDLGLWSLAWRSVARIVRRVTEATGARTARYGAGAVSAGGCHCVPGAVPAVPDTQPNGGNLWRLLPPFRKAPPATR
jgi:uroporphyrinogen-III synthase